MKTFLLLFTSLWPLVLASCRSLPLTPAQIQAKATSTTRVDIKTVELRPFTTGNATSAGPISSAEISVFGVSNTPDVDGFRLIFAPRNSLRTPYLQSKRWVVHQELDSLAGWITALKDIPKNEGVAVFLWQTQEGDYTLSSLRLLTRK
jgi:hypothetical protein